jgi:hypothetical protein
MQKTFTSTAFRLIEYSMAFRFMQKGREMNGRMEAEFIGNGVIVLQEDWERPQRDSSARQGTGRQLCSRT